MIITQATFAFNCFYFPDPDPEVGERKEDYPIYKKNCLSLRDELETRRIRLQEEIKELNEIESLCKYNKPQDWKIINQ